MLLVNEGKNFENIFLLKLLQRIPCFCEISNFDLLNFAGNTLWKNINITPFFDKINLA